MYSFLILSHIFLKINVLGKNNITIGKNLLGCAIHYLYLQHRYY